MSYRRSLANKLQETLTNSESDTVAVIGTRRDWLEVIDALHGDDEALERAARLCDDAANGAGKKEADRARNNACWSLARMIRELKSVR